MAPRAGLRLIALAAALIAMGSGGGARAQDRYDGPVASCPSDPSWKPGEVHLMTSCEGQQCYEGGVWVCHLRPEDRPEARAKRAAARAAANAAVAAQHKARVDAEVVRLGGEHRRAEAERVVAMQDSAEAARLRSLPPQAPVVATPPGPPAPPRLCSMPARNGTLSSDYFTTRTEAAADLRRQLAGRCPAAAPGAPARNATLTGSVQCRAVPTVRFANGKQLPNVECQGAYSCPAYEATCTAPGRAAPASARPG